MLETVYPQNDLLKKYIRYIYRFSTDDPCFKRRLVVFPNTGSAITLYQNCDFHSIDNQNFVSIEKQGSNDVIMHLNRIDPVTMREEGRQKRLVIVFKPLGINQFMNEPPGELLQVYNPSLVPVAGYFEELTELCNGDQMELSLPGLALIIEELLLKRFKPFSNSILDQAIHEMSFTDQLSKIDDLAIHVGTSAKTLNRLFRRHIGLNPVEFRKILQFRNALGNRLTDEKATFRDIAWDNSYYDLPYMIKVFKEFTGRSMKKFFSELSYSADKQYVYIG